MHRTTILLPEELKAQAERQARKEGLSLSELIRRRLSESTRAPGESASFFSRKPWSGGGAVDLAEHHDDYLYGGK